tara:strand:+ start:2747 stop:3049 length:303 start_codon:yes stop_codon:yes gene_type:complete
MTKEPITLQDYLESNGIERHPQVNLEHDELEIHKEIHRTATGNYCKATVKAYPEYTYLIKLGKNRLMTMGRDMRAKMPSCFFAPATGRELYLGKYGKIAV